MAKKIVVIGGSAAGAKAAARARRIDGHAEITIIQKDSDLSMASCGYPYYVGGTFNDRTMLISTPTGVVRNPAFFMNAKNIIARTSTEAVAIDRRAKTVRCKNLLTGHTDDVPYDRLILATGSLPTMPPVPGTELDGITTLHSMRDADYLRKVDEQKIQKAVVVGGGLIGIETCEALSLAGIDVTVVEMLPQILTFLDRELALLVENYLCSKGIAVITGNGVASFLGENGKLTAVKLLNGTELDCQLAVVAIGVRPHTCLAREAGLSIGATGGIIVNEYMQTSDETIYAAGDCVETTNLLTGKKVYAPYGDLANLQGRVAGENAAAGNRAVFPGTIQTGICKIFEYAAGTTGLSEPAARHAGFEVLSVINAGLDKPAFMNGKLLITKLVVERSTGRILGAQCIGPGDVAKQISQWAIAITGKLRVEDMVNADLPYAPPFSQALDHCIATAHVMQNKMRGLLRGISATAVQEKVNSAEKPFLLDVRGPDEFQTMRLGAGEILVPLGTLRKRLSELPEDKDREIICYCKTSLRAYEAARALEAHGWSNVRVMEGGIMAWPYFRQR